MRGQVLLEQPTCNVCHEASSTQVDHIDEDWKNNQRENLQGICEPCHWHKHRNNRNKPTEPNHGTEVGAQRPIYATPAMDWGI